MFFFCWLNCVNLLMSSYFCPICSKIVKPNCNAIQCDICDLWVHHFKCSGLTRKQFEILCDPINSERWFCPSCINSNLPGSFVFNDEEESHGQDSTGDVSSGSNLSDELKSLLSDLNDVVTGLVSSDDDDDESEILFQSNSCSYQTCTDFNSMYSKTPSNFSAFHLNIASMSKHYDELLTLLGQLNCKFSFIGITETKSLRDNEPAPDSLFWSRRMISQFQDIQNFSPLLNLQQVVFPCMPQSLFPLNLGKT